MERKSRLSTPILDRHGKIGPFFVKEALLLLSVILSLCTLVVMVRGFLEIRFWVFLVSLSSCLLALSIVRFFFIKKIDSPWYIHRWIARKFISPKYIVGHLFPLLEKKKVIKKRQEKLERAPKRLSI
jgi:hypothetical protein